MREGRLEHLIKQRKEIILELIADKAKRNFKTTAQILETDQHLAGQLHAMEMLELDILAEERSDAHIDRYGHGNSQKI
jgi:hypothetical protein